MSVPLKTSQASLTLLAGSLSLKSSPSARLRLRRALSRALASDPPSSSSTGGNASPGGASRGLYTGPANGPLNHGTSGATSPAVPHQFFDPSLTLVGALETTTLYTPKDSPPPSQTHPLFGPPSSPGPGPGPRPGPGRQANDGPSSSSSSGGGGGGGGPRTSDSTLTTSTSHDLSDHPPFPLPTSSSNPSHPTSTSSTFLSAPPPKLPSSSSSRLPSFFRPPTTARDPSGRAVDSGGGNFVFRNGAYGIPKGRVKEGEDGEGGDNGGKRSKLSSTNNKGKGRIGASGSPSSMTTGTSVSAEGGMETLSVQVGEDAYFLRPDSLGVADGVGGWRSHPGANPALFSRKLMHHCSHELARYEDVEDPRFLSYSDVDPVQVLQVAYDRCLQEAREEGVVGSSTALVAVLRNDELRIANMGDCCCSIIRGTDYIFRSEEQQHSFNYPFQAGTNSKDTPEKDAQRFTVKVQKNDIVILSSDGLVDNLFDEDILEEVLRFTDAPPPPPVYESPFNASSFRQASGAFASAFGGFSSSSSSSSDSEASTAASTPPPQLTLNRFSPQAVSEALCSRAKAVSEDQRAVTSPFAQRAMEEGIHFVGGKNDDISVLVAVVGDQEVRERHRF